MEGLAEGDGVELAEPGRQVLGAVDDHVVLDVGARADGDLRLISAQHGPKPHARSGLDLDLADEDRGRGDIGVGMHLRALAVELEFHSSL